MAALPPDIIVDVFAKLPAKPLCPFKCLSKSFRALITNPRFVKIHQTETQQGQTLVLVNMVKSFVRNSLLRIDLDSKIITEDQLDFPIKESSFDCLRICCSRNGLLCLSLRDETATETLFIYNCSTREFKRIPNDYEPFTNRDTPLVSLGYAQSIDEFKVLGFSDSHRNAKEVVGVHVFSLRNNTWKTFETDFKSSHHCSRATNLNGTVHFGFCKLNSDSMKDSDFILSVLDEKFVLIDPKDGKKYEDFMIDGFQENVRKYHMEVYAESLISPNSRTNFLISEGLGIIGVAGEFRHLVGGRQVQVLAYA
ncbi:putative F-box protein At3g16210 [Citrus clementina]|uniref:putative F-box protein At3g16210 n=1 Tax=Citrus clementina TaxID=85681 RepID=UPI000CED7076|nr:putative F-box protein At3g16210 [Citrus x clementina]